MNENTFFAIAVVAVCVMFGVMSWSVSGSKAKIAQASAICLSYDGTDWKNGVCVRKEVKP